MTKYRKYSSSLGREWMSPTATVTARCYHKTLLTWSEQQSCKWNAWLTMKKDGNQAWHEHWSDQTEATHQGAVTKYEYYQCRGNGIYSLTIDDINMKSSNNGIVDHWTSVYPKAVTATGKGC
ncbi:hypothetical protein [Streptomyces sp. NPDC048200]|uniref:hypothetical protein n=1 Tax=Streptomyces sp. NPDC048200 TaxID=3365512 RepID=UPI003723C85E